MEEHVLDMYECYKMCNVHNANNIWRRERERERKEQKKESK